MSRFLSLLFVLCLGASASFGQILEPVKWSFDTKKTAENEYELQFTSTIESGWHVYSQHIEEGGPIPTAFEFEEVKGFNLVGKVQEVGDIKEEHSQIFDMTLRYFKKKVTFVQKVKITEVKGTATGYLTFMTCNDKTCLPPTDVDFSFSVERSSTSPDDSRSEVTPTNEETNAAVNKEKNPETTAEVKPEENPGKEEVVAEQPDAKEEKIEEAEVANTEENNPELEVETTPEEEEETGSRSMNRKGSAAGDIKGDEDSPLDWTYALEPVGDNEFDLTLSATAPEGWTIYSMIQEDQEATYTTLLEFEGDNKVEMVGVVKEEGDRKSGFDKYFEADVAKFYENASFTQRIKVDNPEQPFLALLGFVTCNDIQCRFGNLDFMIDPTQPTADIGTAVDSGADLGFTNIGEVPSEPETVEAGMFGEPVQPCGEKKSFSSLWVIFVLGFLGGLIALLTPCVFPMIPLTVSFFTKQSKTKTKGIQNAILYGLSIIVIYVSLGTSLTLLFGPEIMNRLSTDMILNLVFFALFVIFAISFFGYFEITLPSSWANKTDRMADRGGMIGIFFMAFTLGIVSFSCTGPIIGTLLVEAGTSGANQFGSFALGPPIGMLGFSLALALPFAFFAAFPGWLNSLPKSGGWMNTVKVTLGFLELALALKFLSVVDMTQSWGILKYELFMGLWILIFLGLSLYLFGFIKFPHDPPKAKLSKGRLAFGAMMAAFTIYLATGLSTNPNLGTYNSLPVLSGLAPPTHYAIFKDEPEAVQTGLAKVDGVKTGECPIGLDCFKDYEKGLAYAKKVKKPVLIDFTGFGCVNCRKMEEHVWPNESILNKLKDDFVLVSLYVDDRTKLPEPYISELDGKKKRTVGQKWADFQATHFNANSQPYYVLVSHEERLLNNPRGYTPDVGEFDDFLTCGLDAFSKVCPDCDELDTRIGFNE
ncbi:MAG: cytochrome c biogenesis protein CcdA [Bacteroidota bacterium]